MTQQASLTDLSKARSMTGQQAGGTTVAAFFKANREAMQSVLPKHVDAERMTRLALHCMRTTPKLMECRLDTLMGAVMTCAQLGLEPNTPLGHAYLIPFRNNKANCTEVQVIVGYKGLLDLARRSGRIKSIRAEVVREHDEFELNLGTESGIKHKPKMNGERGKAVGYYSVADFTDGGYQFEYMSMADIEAIKKRSRASGAGPWVTDFDQMARKTVIRRLSNYLPLSIEFATAVSIEGAASAGASQGLDRVLEGDFSVLGNIAESHDDTGDESGDESAQAAEPDQTTAAAAAEGKQTKASTTGKGKASQQAQSDDADQNGTHPLDME